MSYNVIQLGIQYGSLLINSIYKRAPSSVMWYSLLINSIYEESFMYCKVMQLGVQYGSLLINYNLVYSKQFAD